MISSLLTRVQGEELFLYKAKLSALLSYKPIERLYSIIDTNDVLIKYNFHFYGFFLG